MKARQVGSRRLVNEEIAVMGHIGFDAAVN